MMGVLDTYAKANGYTVILDVSGQGSPVLWASETTDITQPIVEAYNVQSGVCRAAQSSWCSGCRNPACHGSSGKAGDRRPCKACAAQANDT